MRCVRGDGTEEWLAFLPLGVHPRQCLVEKDVGAIALRLHEPAVAADDGIVIGVARGIAAAAGIALPDAAAAVNKDPIEAPLPRLVGILITEMPLAEDAGRVAAGPPQQLRQRHGRQRQPLALEDRMGDTRTKLMAAGHERGPRRRAGRAHVKFSEPHALIAKPIEVGRVDDRIAVRGDVAIALVVGHHVDDVRPLRRRCRGRVGGLPVGGKRPALVGNPIPGRLQFGDPRRLFPGTVVRLATIRRQIVELPRGVFCGDEFPVADTDGAVPLVAPPERVVRRRGRRIAERLHETPTLQRRHGLSIMLHRGPDTGEFEHRRHDVDHVHRLAAQLPLGGDALGPMDDPGRRDAPLVDPGFVAAKRRVRTARPARPQAEVRHLGAGRGRRVVSLATHGQFGRGAVITREENERVLKGPHRLELR